MSFTVKRRIASIAVFAILAESNTTAVTQVVSATENLEKRAHILLNSVSRFKV